MSLPSLPDPSGPPPVPSILERSPMGIGELFTTSWRALRRAPGLLVGLMLVQVVLVWVAVALGVGVFVALVGLDALDQPAGTDMGPHLPRIIIAGIISGLLCPALIAAASIKLTAMQVSAVDQLARGTRPSWSSTKAATRGVIGRALVLLGLGLVAALVMLSVIGLVIGLFAVALDSADQGGSSGGAALAGILMAAVIVAVYIGIIYLSVRLVYANAVLALEGRSGLDVLRRSLQLTKGSFWRTLGFYIVGMLVPSFASSAVQMVLSPAVAASATPDAQGNMEPNLVALAIVGLLTLLVSLATAIWGVVYVTVMYIDAVRRKEIERLAPAGTSTAPVFIPGNQMTGLQQPGWPQQQPGQQQWDQQAPQQQWGGTPQPGAWPQQGSPWPAQPQQQGGQWPNQPQQPGQWPAPSDNQAPAQPTPEQGSTWPQPSDEPTAQIPGEEPTRQLPPDEPRNPWAPPQDRR
ncbi:glycerophosphoryl diester phosphodiesterase membrane domain-containing protein [Luteococcus peritonei]|uniref:Glycerophosphoryl diester phosphodiesterase membrane domain-containing protein n=1 Tax=Luteococcus peritonei TaxID=88874 RepID=A0ABW4RU63_9ACTN